MTSPITSRKRPRITGAAFADDGTWSNFPRRFSVRPERVVVPENLEDLRSLLREAENEGNRIRVVGSGHSYSDIAIAPETQVFLRRLNRVLEVDLERQQLTVEGGITLREIRAEMQRHGLAFQNMGDIDQQTIAGAISTGTHGTGLTAPAFAGQIVALELMHADGEVRRYTAEDGDLFDAARVSLGALGIVVSVTLQAIPQYTLCRVDTVISRDQAFSLLESPPAHIDHIGMYFMPYIDEVLMWSAQRVPQQPAPPSARVEWFRDVIKVNRGLDLMGSVARRAPRMVPALNRLFAKGIKTDAVVDSYDKIFLRPLFVRHDAWEFAVATEHGVTGVQQLMTAIESSKAPVAFPCETRIAPAETAWLHPQYDRTSTWVGAAVQAPGIPIDDAWELAQNEIVKLGGRPHWGKWHTLDHDRLAPLYPRWNDFQELRAQFDPSGIFGSPAIDRVLGAR